MNDFNMLLLYSAVSGVRRYIWYTCTDTKNGSIYELNFTERNLVIEQIIEKMDLWQADLK